MALEGSGGRKELITKQVLTTTRSAPKPAPATRSPQITRDTSPAAPAPAPYTSPASRAKVEEAPPTPSKTVVVNEPAKSPAQYAQELYGDASLGDALTKWFQSRGESGVFRMGTEVGVPSKTDLLAFSQPTTNATLLATSGYGQTTTPQAAPVVSRTSLPTTPGFIGASGVGGRGTGAAGAAPYTSAGSRAKAGDVMPAPGSAPGAAPVSGRPLAQARELTSGALKPRTPPVFTSGWMTPSEARGGMGYGPSTAIFTGAGTQEDAVKAAAWRVETFLSTLGVRPEFITSDVQRMLGINPGQMESMGYVQAPNGQWYRVNYSPSGLGTGGTPSGAGAGGGGSGGGGQGGGYSYSPAGSWGSNYRSDLINWRIGL